MGKFNYYYYTLLQLRSCRFYYYYYYYYYCYCYKVFKAVYAVYAAKHWVSLGPDLLKILSFTTRLS